MSNHCLISDDFGILRAGDSYPGLQHFNAMGQSEEAWVKGQLHFALV
jgi:hypothetical protein